MSDELSEGWILLLLGSLLLAGYAAHILGRRLHVPRVTLMMLTGVVVGPYVLDIVPHSVANWFPYVAHLALAMIGFLLGESFAGRRLKRMGPLVVGISVGEAFVTALVVFVAVLLWQQSLTMALLLAGIAPATAPAATVDIIKQNGAKGPVSQTVLGVVAVDDAWGIVLFGMLLAIAEPLAGMGDATEEILWGIWDVFGAILLGIILGFPAAFLTGRLRKGEPQVLEAMGFVFLCGGLATLLHVSYLLACMVLGVVVANRARHHTRPFHLIEGASDPFLAIFFVLAGFRLELDALLGIGSLGVVYVLARSFGKVVGSQWSSKLVGAQPVVQQHLGWCLLPQAGVALGLALLANEKFPSAGLTLLPLVIATTVIFEVIGPLFTQRHLQLAGELDDSIDTADQSSA